MLNLYLQHGDVQLATSSQPSDLKQSSFIEQLCSWVVSERFRGFLLGYAKAINKQESRTGSLFQKGFRRKYVPDGAIDKKRVLFYVHHNPIHHFYTNNYIDYTWSSYNTYLTVNPTRLSRDEAMDWFGSKEKFIDFGEQYKNNKNFSDQWIIDED